jgi:hypothetical protein
MHIWHGMHAHRCTVKLGAVQHLGRGQPVREAAKVPLSADVWTWAQQHEQAQLMRNAEKALQVGKALPVELPRLRLVQVPRHVELQQARQIR